MHSAAPMPLSVLELPADTQRCILSSLDPVAECFGGCAECGKPACLGDPDGYWEADGHCPEVVECLDCGARGTSASSATSGP